MSSKKKKAQPNAFYFFMKEFQDSQRQMGRHYTMQEIPALCGDMWGNLPPEEKQYYQQLANDEKNRIKQEKFNSKGEALQKVHQVYLGREIVLREMNEEITATIEFLDPKTTLLTKVFHLIHINYFCKTDQGVFIPAEIALAEFTLRDGIIRVVHSFVKAGEIPKGYCSAALEHCNDTHHTPIDLKYGDGKVLESSGPDEILQMIVDVLKPDGGSMGELSPLYTMPDEVNIALNESCAVSIFEYLCERGGLPPNTFRLFNLPKLFFELRNKARKHSFPNISLALSELEKDVFKYTNGLACDFHEEEDVSPYCSKSIVKRWVYVICDHLCKDLGVPLRPGFHCPKNADLKGYSRRRVATENVEASSKLNVKEDRNSNYYASQGELPIREPHSSRASKFWDSEACSLKSVSSKASSVVTNDELDSSLGACAAREAPPKRGWGNPAAAGGGWSRVASSSGDNIAPQIDNLADFPSIGSSTQSRRNHNSNTWTQAGRGRGRNMVGDMANLRID